MSKQWPWEHWWDCEALIWQRWVGTSCPCDMSPRHSTNQHTTLGWVHTTAIDNLGHFKTNLYRQPTILGWQQQTTNQNTRCSWNMRNTTMSADNNYNMYVELSHFSWHPTNSYNVAVKFASSYITHLQLTVSQLLLPPSEQCCVHSQCHLQSAAAVPSSVYKHAGHCHCWRMSAAQLVVIPDTRHGSASVTLLRTLQTPVNASNILSIQPLHT